MKLKPDQPLGVIAAGHEQTVMAARSILEEGGNAYDAVIAAHLMACVAEPVLSSLAGGGFMLAHTSGGQNTLYDFFVQTPLKKRHADETEFFPIKADFGTTRQEFHIGLGSMATPGTVRGLFAIHRELGTLPMARLAEPAIRLARNGVVMNAFQAYILDIVQAIYREIPGALEIFGSRISPEKLVQEGELHRQSDLGDTIETMAREGEDLFIRGGIARNISRLCRENGGHLTMEDFSRYEIIRRKPLKLTYRKTDILTNPPPSSGGLLIAFALKLMEEFRPGSTDSMLHAEQNENSGLDLDFGSSGYLELLAGIQELTDQARVESGFDKSMGSAGQRGSYGDRGGDADGDRHGGDDDRDGDGDRNRRRGYSEMGDDSDVDKTAGYDERDGDGDSDRRGGDGDRDGGGDSDRRGGDGDRDGDSVRKRHSGVSDREKHGSDGDSDGGSSEHDPWMKMLDPEFLRLYREQVRKLPRFSRGTTHISIMDRQGNMASLTTSNGEGCGHILPGTGIMLNNMLGEEDLNPVGFHRWSENSRMSSMMAPTMLLMPDGKKITLGSGGSNRLRTAILQVILNIVDFGMPLDEAVKSPRIHCERGALSVEGGFEPGRLQNLRKQYPGLKIWDGWNLFFGGVHAACNGPDGFEGSGDPRRGGSVWGAGK